MLAKILFVIDLHKREHESMSIKGSREVQTLIQYDIINFCKAQGITHVFIMGDWYHRGYHAVGHAIGDMVLDQQLSDAVNGNVYLLIGNHFFLERDDNPEMYLIQPNDYVKPQTDISIPDKPIFKLERELRIGDVLISFFHFNKTNKNYVNMRDPSIKYHIGCYHDDVTVPTWIAEEEGFTGRATSTYLNQIYGNVDLGIHGHIHISHGVVPVELATGRKVPLLIPGSLGITQNVQKHKHLHVDLPVITIADDSSVQVQTAKFSTHLEMLRFYNINKSKKKAIDALSGDDNRPQFTSNTSVRSFVAYAQQKGYSRKQMRLIEAANQNALSLSLAVSILMEVEKEDEPANTGVV